MGFLFYCSLDFTGPGPRTESLEKPLGYTRVIGGRATAPGYSTHYCMYYTTLYCYYVYIFYSCHIRTIFLICLISSHRHLKQNFRHTIMPIDSHSSTSGVDASTVGNKRKSIDIKSGRSSDNLTSAPKRIKPTKSNSRGVSLKGDAIPLGKFLASNGRAHKDVYVASLRIADQDLCFVNRQNDSRPRRLRVADIHVWPVQDRTVSRFILEGRMVQ